MGFIITGIIVLLIIVYIILTVNSINSLVVKIEEAFANMDVYLKKRYDLIPNLVEVCKSYATHEKDLFTEIAQSRSKAMESGSINDVEEANDDISRCIGKLFAVTEAYPELKSDRNFLNLQDQLSGIENDLINARKYYNGSVKIYNNKIIMFPSVIVAKIMGKSKLQYFDISSEERKNVSFEL